MRWAVLEAGSNGGSGERARRGVGSESGVGEPNRCSLSCGMFSVVQQQIWKK